MEKLKEDRRKAKADTKASNHRLTKIEDISKCKLDAIAEQLSISVEIGYGMAMDSFKKKAKKKGMGEYYYKILDMIVTPQ